MHFFFVSHYFSIYKLVFSCSLSKREFTYKVHYMMFTLALLKSLDLMFQAVSSCNCFNLSVLLKLIPQHVINTGVLYTHIKSDLHATLSVWSLSKVHLFSSVLIQQHIHVHTYLHLYCKDMTKWEGGSTRHI